METAKAKGHEPYACIKHVLTEVPATQILEDLHALLPFHMPPIEHKAA
ncbi:MAG: transposase domain-containing protein [Granulosicoccus sp.]|nr:transposase domain-containing protein [Granulosicoccus sp.]